MLSAISRRILKLMGWTLVGDYPQEKKFVGIVAPHTSNWDFFFFLLVKWAFKIKVVFIGKHTLFVGPIGWALRKIGGLPIDRRSPHNTVDMIVEEFNKRDKMIFGLSPEGTRSYLDHWKSGFYHIALKAKVPIKMAYIDTTTKTIGWGPKFYPSGDKIKDLELIRNFFSDKKGFKPEKFSKIVFKDGDG